jgi:hypothetical protein
MRIGPMPGVAKLDLFLPGTLGNSPTAGRPRWGFLFDRFEIKGAPDSCVCREELWAPTDNSSLLAGSHDR